MTPHQDRALSAAVGSLAAMVFFCACLLLGHAWSGRIHDANARKIGVSPPRIEWVSEAGRFELRYAFDLVSRECFIAQDGILNDVSLTPVDCASIGFNPGSVVAPAYQ